MRWTRSIIPVVGLSLLSACAEVEEASVATTTAAPATAEVAADDAAAVRREIEATNARFLEAYNRDDVAGFADVYTGDAVIYPPDMEPIRGKEGIRKFWQGGHDQMGIRNVRLTTDEVETIGDTAWETGRANFDTGQGPVAGKYMVVWKKTPEGWRWHRDIWNMNPAADR